MYTFNFHVTAYDVDAHVKNCITEEEREKFKDFKFVPLEVNVDENRDIEIKAVAVVDYIEGLAEEEETDEEVNE